jgi:hypothetical protein
MAFRFQSWRSCTIRPAARSRRIAAHILDVAGDVVSRKGLLQPEALTAGNIVALPGR